MSAKLYNWLIAPERSVVATIATGDDDNSYVVSWNTSHGPIKVSAPTLDAAIRKAFEIDHNKDPDERLRLAYMPTAKHHAWSLGVLPTGEMGWNGFILVNAEMPDDVEFELPKLPRGWKYREAATNIRHHGRRRVAYLEECGRGKFRFSFEMTASRAMWQKDHSSLFAGLCEAVGEVERAHYII